jgi:hypothetical protein
MPNLDYRREGEGSCNFQLHKALLRSIRACKALQQVTWHQLQRGLYFHLPTIR